MRAAEEQTGQSQSAALVTKLEQHEKTQRAHAARLQRIAERLERLENFDPEAALAEVRAGVDAAVEQISHSSLMRGEKSQRLRTGWSAWTRRRSSAGSRRSTRRSARST